MQKVLENRCQSCKKSDNFLGKYTSRAISPIYETPHLHNDNHSDNDCKKALYEGSVELGCLLSAHTSVPC